MFRSKSAQRLSIGALGVTLAYIVVSACTEPPAGCTVGQRLPRHFSLVSVNGQQVASPGVPIPGTFDRLRGGSLEFTTDECTSSDASQGSVVAWYFRADDAGNPKQPNKSYGGSFEYNASTGALTLRAFGQSRTGTYSRTTGLFTINTTVDYFSTASAEWVFVGQ